MWMNSELTTAHKNFIYSRYPKVWNNRLKMIKRTMIITKVVV
jgi:hypothetical protein